jgi:hypothetical protein
MSVLNAASSSCGIEEDILVPLRARLTAIGAVLDVATPPPGQPPRSPAATFSSGARAMLEKVRREMVQLERVFHRVDDAERRIRYSFDPLERHLDDALQHGPTDMESIHAGLLAVDHAINARIREVYNIPCVDCGGADDSSATSPAQEAQPPAACAGVVMTRKMGQIRHGPQMNHLRLAVSGLEERLRSCVLCLAAFPEGAVIKKRLLIHWWMGEGFVESATRGKQRFDELAANGFIVPAPTATPCGTVHRCTVRPWMRDLLASLAKRNAFLEVDAGDGFASARRACLTSEGGIRARPPGFSAAARAIYNVGQRYVELDERWLARKKDLRVLQLGQWREFSTHEQIANPMASHVEISGGGSRFRDLESCRNLRYVSFRGMSRVESLPDSIGKLHELVVLDLRACHDLEELGQGLTRLDRLEYLDLSECHLLAGMPKGLGQLTRLQILKGFVVASSNSRDPCHLNELTKLDKLRKLGIVIGKMAVPLEDEFLKLADFKALESLKISWGMVITSTKKKENRNVEASPRHSPATMKYALPPNLKKLDLHCFPLTDFAQWVPPTAVEKLYIRGGKLATFGDQEGWAAEVLRLRFLSDLRCDHNRLQRLFRKLKPETTEIHGCPNFNCSNDVLLGESAEIHVEQPGTTS